MMKACVCTDSSARSEVLGGLWKCTPPSKGLRGRGEGSKHQAWPEQKGVVGGVESGTVRSMKTAARHVKRGDWLENPLREEMPLVELV